MVKYRLGWHKDSYLGYANNLDDARKLAVKIWKENPDAHVMVQGIEIYVGKDRYGMIYLSNPHHPKFHKDYSYYELIEFNPKTGKLLETSPSVYITSHSRFTKDDAKRFFRKVAYQRNKSVMDVMTENEFTMTLSIDLRAMSYKDANRLLEYMKKENIVIARNGYIKLNTDGQKIKRNM